MQILKLKLKLKTCTLLTSTLLLNEYEAFLLPFVFKLVDVIEVELLIFDCLVLLLVELAPDAIKEEFVAFVDVVVDDNAGGSLDLSKIPMFSIFVFDYEICDFFFELN